VLSDAVADQIVRLRKKAGLRRDQLAERCKQLGAVDLTAATLANIETGRRDKATGKRRRRVTVEELLALAIALDVPPVWLLADPLRGEPVPVVDGREIAPWEALLWLVGSGSIDGGIVSHPQGNKTLDLIWHGRVVAEAAGVIRRSPAWMVDRFRDTPGMELRLAGVSSREDPEVMRSALDEIHRRQLQSMREAMERIAELGAAIPQVGPKVLERAAELGIELPGQDGEAAP